MSATAADPKKHACTPHTPRCLEDSAPTLTALGSGRLRQLGRLLLRQPAEWDTGCGAATARQGKRQGPSGGRRNRAAASAAATGRDVGATRQVLLKLHSYCLGVFRQVGSEARVKGTEGKVASERAGVSFFVVSGPARCFVWITLGLAYLGLQRYVKFFWRYAKTGGPKKCFPKSPPERPNSVTF